MVTHTLFKPGRIRASESVRSLGLNLEHYVNRHLVGDWGDVVPRIEAANEVAVRTGDDAIGSAYKTPAGWLFVITNADRSTTTILLPSDVEAYL